MRTIDLTQEELKSEGVVSTGMPGPSPVEAKSLKQEVEGMPGSNPLLETKDSKPGKLKAEEAVTAAVMLRSSPVEIKESKYIELIEEVIIVPEMEKLSTFEIEDSTLRKSEIEGLVRVAGMPSPLVPSMGEEFSFFESQESKHKELVTKVGVIGAGIAGVTCALKLLEAHPHLQLTLIEESKELLNGTSNAAACRPSLGAHYPDHETGAHSLEMTCEFVLAYKKHDGFLIGVKDEKHQHLRYCDYVVAKDSTHSPEEVKAILNNLQKKYREIVRNSPEIIDFFGEPDSFWKQLEPSEYAKTLNQETVAAVFKIPEHIMDWPKFQQFLIKQIEDHPSIEIRKNTKVLEIIKRKAKTLSGYQYDLLTQEMHAEQKTLQGFDFIVNSTWTSAATLDGEVDPECFRLKAMVKFETPEKFNGMSHQFVCFGEIGTALSFRSDGTGFATYEKVTNVWQGPKLTDYPKRFLENTATDAEVKSIAQRILIGASIAYPGIQDAIISTVKFGVVITDGGPVDLKDKSGSHTSRRYTGVKVGGLPWVTNQSRKHIYARFNGDMIVILYSINQLFSGMIRENLHVQFPWIISRLCKDIIEPMVTGKITDIGQHESKCTRIIDDLGRTLSARENMHKALLDRQARKAGLSIFQRRSFPSDDCNRIVRRPCGH